MSLVGTRPPTVDEWDKYELHHRARLATKPGLTGMWQVSGRSNITDLDSFFMEAPYGAWAEEYVNKLIKQINEISLDIKNEQDIEKIKAEIEQLEKKVEVIGEELIRDSLLKKLKRLKYKIIEKNTLRKNREEEIKYLEERLKMLREND